jgi:hypothetical protein
MRCRTMSLLRLDGRLHEAAGRPALDNIAAKVPGARNGASGTEAAVKRGRLGTVGHVEVDEVFIDRPRCE